MANSVVNGKRSLLQETIGYFLKKGKLNRQILALYIGSLTTSEQETLSSL